MSVGFVVHLNYDNPYLSPFEEFQRFKTHPLVRDTFAGGKRIGYGARAITEGGYQSVPKLAFPGGALIGCAAGFVNVPRIKGTHNAVLSGMLAAEHVAQALAARPRQRRARRLRGGVARHREIGRDLWKVRNAKPLWSRFGTMLGIGLGGLDMWTNTLGLLAVRHARSRQARRRTPQAGRAMPPDRLSAGRTASSPSTGCPRCSCPTPTTRRISRSICGSPTWRCRSRPSTTSMRARRRAIVRPASTSGWRRAGRPRFVINAQNCVHCKTCDIKDPNRNITWVTPEGGGGPNYPNM